MLSPSGWSHLNSTDFQHLRCWISCVMVGSEWGFQKPPICPSGIFSTEKICLTVIHPSMKQPGCSWIFMACEELPSGHLLQKAIEHGPVEIEKIYPARKWVDLSSSLCGYQSHHPTISHQYPWLIPGGTNGSFSLRPPRASGQGFWKTKISLW